MASTNSLDQQCINTLRFLSVDMVQKANSGHPVCRSVLLTAQFRILAKKAMWK
jgi:transketolase